MNLPVLSAAYNYTTSAAWDVALTLVEMMSLGWRGWWWRLHWAARRQFLFDPPAHVMIREAPALDLPDGQCVYGETPALSLLAMLRRVEAGPDDVLFDLGCGRGLTVMAAALGAGIRAVGIDAVATLIERARRMARDLDIADRVTLLEGNFLEQDLSSGSIFYVASTTFRPEVMRALAARIADSVPPERTVRAITLSQPLGAPFRIVRKERYPMTWGWATVYFQDLEREGRSSR